MKKAFGAGAVALLALLSWTATYTLDETQQAVITRFGEPVGSTVARPGLHLKVPIADRVNRFDRRWLEWSGDPNQIPTKDKKYIWVATFARWRIADPLLFFQRMRDERTALSRIDDIIDGETRNTIATYELIEAVRATNRDFGEDEFFQDDRPRSQEKVEVGRDHLTRRVLEKASPTLRSLGVELVDVQFKRINYVDEVQVKVFERMVSERRRIAERFRSEGQGQSAEIRGQKERELKAIRSEAFRRAQELKGKADAEASRIYADAYGKDPDFYAFWRSLDTLRSTIDGQTSMLLGTESELYRHLGSSRPGKP